MFRGRYVHTIDAKSRLAIPASFRSEMERRSDRAPIVTNGEHCLALYPYEDWCAYEQRLLSLPSVDPEVQELIRFMVSGAVECPIDRQGRILVPSLLREYAGLQREVTLAGMATHIELWDKARLDDHLAKTRARYHEIASSIAAKERV